MINTQSFIADIVAANYRSASVFRKYGIDFCCGGNKQLGRVCEEKNISCLQLLQELNSHLSERSEAAVPNRKWTMSRLIDHIEKRHHRYVNNAVDVLQQYLITIARLHGRNNPELLRILTKFQELSGELTAHMRKEELVLFPYIRKLEKGYRQQEPMNRPHFKTIRNLIITLEEEHADTGGRLGEIRELSDNYTPPAHASKTFKVAYKMLYEFEKDLHLHVHLENNILFPKAIVMEKMVFAMMHEFPKR